MKALLFILFVSSALSQGWKKLIAKVSNQLFLVQNVTIHPTAAETGTGPQMWKMMELMLYPFNAAGTEITGAYQNCTYVQLEGSDPNLPSQQLVAFNFSIDAIPMDATITHLQLQFLRGCYFSEESGPGLV